MATELTITLPREYGYVILTTVCTALLAHWHAIRMGPYRRAAKVPYPLPYAFSTPPSTGDPEAKAAAEKAAYLFNCAQRAHGNYVENYPMVPPLLLTAGVRFPVTTSLLGVAWCVNRVIYAVGYTRADKERGTGRFAGSGWYICQLGLLGLSIYTGTGLLLGV